MHSFEHDAVTRFADVRRKVGRRDVLIAGGTDLVTARNPRLGGGYALRQIRATRLLGFGVVVL